MINKLIKLASGRSFRNERGATMIEYALLAGLIAAVAVGVITTVGTEVQTKFQSIADAI
jgi:pilus assembly protein Flp/PilA